MARRARKSKAGYRTGYCMFVHGQYPCPGKVHNGSNIGGVTLCACNCHGDFVERQKAIGQYVEPVEDEEEEDNEGDG